MPGYFYVHDFVYVVNLDLGKFLWVVMGVNHFTWEVRVGSGPR